MPTTFEEGHLRFRFDDSWSVLKYDSHPDYRRIEQLDGTKAVDFVAIHQDRELYLIEVKDFRGYRIENKERLNGELAVEVAQKVRDTIPGIIGAHHRGSDQDWSDVVKRMTSREPPIRVLLWLEQDLPTGRIGRGGRSQNNASILVDSLRRKLGWLTSKIQVSSLDVGRPPVGLTVENLPGAAQGS